MGRKVEKDKVYHRTPGRPKTVEIDWDTFEKLCGIQCTIVEIADFFRCSVDTIRRRVKQEYGCLFNTIFQQKRAAGKAALRRAQMKTALNGHPIMQIFLGKQYLDQEDKKSIQQKTDVTVQRQLSPTEIKNVRKEIEAHLDEEAEKIYHAQALKEQAFKALEAPKKSTVIDAKLEPEKDPTEGT